MYINCYRYAVNTDKTKKHFNYAITAPNTPNTTPPFCQNIVIIFSILLPLSLPYLLSLLFKKLSCKKLLLDRLLRRPLMLKEHFEALETLMASK